METFCLCGFKFHLFPLLIEICDWNSTPLGLWDSGIRRRAGPSYWEAWGGGFSDLVSCVAGGLLFHGLLFPRAGELLKSSSSSMPLAASYCVFSNLVISLSSSSPNSPPIRVGSPTTITSCEQQLTLLQGNLRGEKLSLKQHREALGGPRTDTLVCAVQPGQVSMSGGRDAYWISTGNKHRLLMCNNHASLCP